MADKKISELTAYTPAVDVDLVPIVDTTTGVTKHITWANIKATLKTYFDSLTTTLTNKTLTSPKVGTAIADTSGNEIIKTPATGSAVNEVTITNSATGNAVEISATGDDTNIHLKLSGKGTGGIKDKNNDYLSSNSSLARQAIINGNFDVWQRGTSFSITADQQFYLADRWGNFHRAGAGGTLPTVTVSRQVLTAGGLFNSFYHHRIAVNGAGTSLGTNALAQLYQKIEYGNRFLCGDGKKVTVSFWAKSDIANKLLGLSLVQEYGTGGSPSAAEILDGTNWTLTSTWTKYTYTFTTNTLASKTFGTNNDDHLDLFFQVMWADQYKARVGAASAETYVGSGFIDIAQVQLCAGDVALPFMPKSFNQEILDCQRYYQKSYAYDFFAGGITDHTGMEYTIISGTNLRYTFNFLSKMRTTPTVVIYAEATGNSANVSDLDSANADLAVTHTSTPRNCWISGTSTDNHRYQWHWTAEAEL